MFTQIWSFGGKNETSGQIVPNSGRTDKRTNERTDGQKKRIVEVGAPPKNTRIVELSRIFQLLTIMLGYESLNIEKCLKSTEYLPIMVIKLHKTNFHQEKNQDSNT